MTHTQKKDNYGIWFLCFLNIYVIFRPSEIIVFNTFYPIYLLSIFVIYLNLKKLTLLFSINKLKIIFILIFSLFLLSAFNSYINDFYDRKVLFNWLAWFVVMVSVILSSTNIEKNFSIIELMAKLVLIVQLCISIVQLFVPDFFSLLWSSTNTLGLQSAVRVSGSMGNPILFSFIISYLVLIVIARTGPVKKILWVLLGSVLIIMSGSRSLILTYPIIVAAWFYLSDTGAGLLKRLSFSFIYAVFLFFFSYALLYFFKELFVYSAELLVMFGDSSSDVYSQALIDDKKNLRTFGYRVDYWNAALAEFFSRDLVSSIFGKSGPYLSSPHHDLIYMLSRYGVIGLILYIALHLFFLEIAFNNKKPEGRLLYLVILLSLTVGMANSIGIEMRLGILSSFIVGLLLSREMYLFKVIRNVEVKSSIKMDNEIKRVSSTKSLPA